MDDIASKLSQILNSPEGMEQLRSVAASLGLGENGGNSPLNNFQNNSQNNNQNNTGTLNNSNNNNSNSNNNTGGLDLSAISSLLSGLGGGGNNSPQPQNNASNAPSLLPNIDLNTIMRLQQAMSQFSSSDKNVDLLLALKPHFGEERRKKVDDAIRIMQLIKLLPLIKESGIFGGGLF